jgi:hypothetical protein
MTTLQKLALVPAETRHWSVASFAASFTDAMTDHPKPTVPGFGSAATTRHSFLNDLTTLQSAVVERGAGEDRHSFSARVSAALAVE